MLSAKGDLAAAELAFFTPALLIAIVVLIRHGFSKKLGWLYVCTLSLLRIIGAATTLYMETQNDYNSSLIETAAICSAIGTAPLLLALMGFLERINQGMSPKGISMMVFRPIHLAAIAGLIVSIIGGTDEGSSNTSTFNTGRDLLKAASVIFFFVYVALSTLALLTARDSRYVLPEEKILLRACLLALPFLLVRLVYTLAVGFAPAGSVFYFGDVNAWVQAFMQFLMEAIVVCLYISAGLMTPRAPKRDQIRDVEGASGRVEMLSQPEPKYEQQEQYQQRPRYQPPPQQQRERSLGDYRPSRMIMNAIRDRQ